MVRESKRSNPSYRRHAIACLGQFVELREEADLFEQIYEIVEPVIRESLDDTDDMDVDSATGSRSSKAMYVYVKRPSCSLTNPGNLQKGGNIGQCDWNPAKIGKS